MSTSEHGAITEQDSKSYHVVLSVGPQNMPFPVPEEYSPSLLVSLSDYFLSPFEAILNVTASGSSL